MTQLANCPQCDHELIVPDGTIAGAWVRCPSCQAFFQLDKAQSRDLPMVEIIGPGSEPAGDDHRAVPTVADFSSMPTWSAAEEHQASGGAASSSTPLHIADGGDETELPPSDDLDFADLHAMFDDHEKDRNDAADISAAQVLDFDEPGDAPDRASLHLADVADIDEPSETLAAEANVESPEAAAERIDAWFRSAKTVADVPPVESVEVDYPPVEREEPRRTAATSATVDLGSGGVNELAFNDDFELDEPSSPHMNTATWDDSQHMDELLAELKDHSLDEVDSARDANADVEGADFDQPVAAAAQWSDADVDSILPHGEELRRGKSFVRTLVMSTVGGLMGLALGYIALLWIGATLLGRGREIDFLNVSQHLPQVILPGALQSTPHASLASSPPIQSTSDGATVAPAAPEPMPATDETTHTVADASQDAETATADTASFNEPVAGKSATAGNPPAEPAEFSAPPAAPVKEASAGESIQIKNAPSFTSAELAAAVATGKDVIAGLVHGNLADGNEVARAKGASYLLLADLAQKTAFIDPHANEAVRLQGDAAEVYRSALAEPRTREEVAQIVPKWLVSTKRTHGGVFFAGTFARAEIKGSVAESTVDMGSNQSVPVLLSPALVDGAKGSPVAIIGWVVDQPVENVSGYSGSTPQAVYAAKVIPLP